MGSGDCSFISWPILYPVMAFGFTEKKKTLDRKIQITCSYIKAFGSQYFKFFNSLIRGWGREDP